MPTTTYGKGKLIAGLIFLFLCLPCDALGVGMVACPTNEGDAATGMGFFIFCTVVLGIPAAVLLVLGARERKRGKAIEHITALATASARIPLQQVAADLDVTEAAARKLLLDAIHKRLIAGRIDLEHGTFISAAAHAGVQKIPMHCRNCGGHSQVVVGPGFASNCPFCGARLA